MAVIPARQREGLGRRCLEEAMRTSRDWPADAVRLDAFDAEGGAGGFDLAAVGPKWDELPIETRA